MKIICVGRNYEAHAKELNNAVEENPVIFLKPETALIPNKQPFFYPSFSNDVHYETELVIKICKLGKHIEERFAHRYYNEISLGIDFTARDVQSQLKSKGLPWELAKGFDGSAPLGTFIDKNTFQKPIQDLNFHMKLNGEIKQEGKTSHMIFSVDKIISFVSSFFTLKIGDLIFTGTPAGVGPIQKGDHLEAWLEEVKVLSVKVK
jgi:acylpyruvate hydrolase